MSYLSSSVAYTDVSSVNDNLSLTSTDATHLGKTDDQSADIMIREKAIEIIYMMIGIIGFLGNFFVAVIFIKFKLTKKSFINTYILNQSVIDSITAAFLLLTTVIKENDRYLEGPTDEFFCRFWLGKVPIWSCIMSSTYSLVFLTIERYLEVTHPIWHKLNFDNTKVIISFIFIWLIGPVFNLAYDIPTSKVVFGKCVLLSFWPSMAAQTAAGIIAVTLQYFIPLFIFIFCYASMIYTLHKRVSKILPGNGSSNKETRMSKAKTNVIKTLAIVSVAFILCYSWNQWFFFLFNIEVLNYTHFQSNFYHFSVVAMFINCTVNPFIYALNYEEFRKAVKNLFCCNRNNSNDFQVSSTQGTY